MAKSTKNTITGQERVEHYLNVWGSDKRSLVSILRQLIFILGCIATIVVGIWVVVHAVSFYVDNETFRIITDRIAKISMVFIAFIIVLDGIYLGSELFAYNKKRANRMPSMLIGSGLLLILITFFILTCVELFGINNAERSYIYCIYLVICFSCCLFSTMFCFDVKRKNVVFNPNRKLLRSLSDTIGFLGIFAILTFILWIMWYVGGNTKLSWTCFILARTILTLIGSIIVKLILQIILICVMNHKTNKKTWLISLCVLTPILLGFEIFLGWCFYLEGPWRDQIFMVKTVMSIAIVFVIAISAMEIAIASRYASKLERLA